MVVMGGLEPPMFTSRVTVLQTAALAAARHHRKWSSRSASNRHYTRSQRVASAKLGYDWMAEA